jgi:hypothetical protein
VLSDIPLDIANGFLSGYLMQQFQNIYS